jgi:hypothetical protein
VFTIGLIVAAEDDHELLLGRSSSTSTTPDSASWPSAGCTMPTAPSMMRVRGDERVDLLAAQHGSGDPGA